MSIYYPALWGIQYSYEYLYSFNDLRRVGSYKSVARDIQQKYCSAQTGQHESRHCNNFSIPHISSHAIVSKNETTM